VIYKFPSPNVAKVAPPRSLLLKEVFCGFKLRRARVSKLALLFDIKIVKTNAQSAHDNTPFSLKFARNYASGQASDSSI